MPSDHPITALGAFLTASEAKGLGAKLASGQPTALALQAIGSARREEAKTLLAAAGLGHTDLPTTVAVLHAVVGAKSVRREVTPVWTMPGYAATAGHLTSEFHTLVLAARQSVTCATYNFEPTSQMWTTLRQASEEPGVIVTIYVDGTKANAAGVKAQIPRATLYRSAALNNGKQVVSHAKFVVIDHAVLLLTSANFSYSAENNNVELGLRIEDSALATSIETTMTRQHGSLYELVP